MTAFEQHLFAEIFPVQVSAIPSLSAYRLIIDGGDANTIGGKLAYRLQKILGGHWVWSQARLISTINSREDEIRSIIRSLWSEQPDIFHPLQDLARDQSWTPTAQAHADIVSRSLFGEVHREIMALLTREDQNFGQVLVKRTYDRRGIVVQGEPAISLTLTSRMTSRETLKAFSRTQRPDRLVGLWVNDITSDLKAPIVGVVGPLRDHRARLLSLTQRPEMRVLIEQAPEDELVLKVGDKGYHYIASALQILVRMEDLPRFQANAAQVLKALRFDPGKRAELMRNIANTAKSRGLIANAYSTSRRTGLFLKAEDVNFVPRIQVGSGHTAILDGNSLMNLLKSYGLYRRSADIEAGRPLRIGVINGLGRMLPGPFLGQLDRELRSLGTVSQVVGEERLMGLSRADFEHAIHVLETHRVDILLVALSDGTEDEEDDGPYMTCKSLAVARGLATQVVLESTMQKGFALGNIVLGVLGKTGSIPFILADPLPYADIVVGIDIARRKKTRLQGSMNATALTRIYLQDGTFLRYAIHDAPLEGETIPPAVLQALFPLREFQGKRVVVHRDGRFRGEEKAALIAWGRRIGATFYLVEVIKSGAPRLYAMREKNIVQPPKGSACKVSDQEAILVSSLPPFAAATPQPLQIRTEAPFPIEQAIHSVLALTLLHYGSLRAPRLPVSIHYSDQIAGLVLRGIKPKNLDGDIPFWL